MPRERAECRRAAACPAACPAAAFDAAATDLWLPACTAEAGAVGRATLLRCAAALHEGWPGEGGLPRLAAAVRQAEAASVPSQRN